LINSGKIQDKNAFAKKLVEQRIAANMEDAMEKISNHKDIFMEDDLSLLSDEEPKEVEEPKEELEKPVVKEMEKESKLAELENKFNKLSETINKIQALLNKNFKEIDRRLSELRQMRAAQPAQESREKPEKKPAQPSNNKCDPDNYDQDEVSVENIFSNAHGRLAKK
jgi:hypothetical protein